MYVFVGELFHLLSLFALLRTLIEFSLLRHRPLTLELTLLLLIHQHCV